MNPTCNPKRSPVPFTDTDGIACLRVPLAGNRGEAIIEADALPTVQAAGVTLAWSFNDNGGGRRYVRAKMPGGNTVTVARLIMGAAKRQEVYYRDGDPANLRSANLRLTSRMGQRVVAEQPEGESKVSPKISGKASYIYGKAATPRTLRFPVPHTDQSPAGSR